MQARITTTLLGLAAEIKHEFISILIKEALTKRKAEGVASVTPGNADTLKLDAHAPQIRDISCSAA